jgi:hypothetical protein
MPNSPLSLPTDLRGLCWNTSRTLSMLSSGTRDGPGLLPLHKHPVSTNCWYHVLVWCVFLKPCIKLTLHCNHRSGQLKIEHTVSMRSELLVAHEKLGQLPLLMVYVVPV